MKRIIEGVDRSQTTLFPERLEDWVGEDNPVRVIDAFVDELDLGVLGFDRVVPRWTGRPDLAVSGAFQPPPSCPR
jgi:transposase